MIRDGHEVALLQLVPPVADEVEKSAAIERIYEIRMYSPVVRSVELELLASLR